MATTEDRHESTTEPLPSQEGRQANYVPAPPEGADMVEDSDWGEAEQEDTLTLTSQDEIITPTPLPIGGAWPPTKTPTQRIPCGLWILVLASLAIGLLSLALNGFLIYRLLSARQAVVEGLDAAISGLDGLTGQGFQYDYFLDQTVPIKADIPLNQEFDFPFQGDFPINTIVDVPIDLGIGAPIIVSVPINTTVPINTSVPVVVNETFNLEAEVPLELSIPIQIPPNDPTVQELLAPIRAMLVELRESF